MAGRILWFGIFLLVPATLLPPTSRPDPGKREPWPRYHCPLARPCPHSAEMAGGKGSVLGLVPSGPAGTAFDHDFIPGGIDLAFVPLPNRTYSVRPVKEEETLDPPERFSPGTSPHRVFFSLDELLCNFHDPAVTPTVSAGAKKR
jgi:hypothetical protein